jgi:GNAT superfamily N-acetyltransferase
MTLVNDDRAAAPAIRKAGAEDAIAIAASLAGAFSDDPVFQWFSPDNARRRAMLPAFFAVFTAAYMRRGDIHVSDGVAGAALWATPEIDPLAADPADAERLAEIAGVDAPRLFEVLERLEAHAPQEPHYHLQLLGVRPEHQGAGIGGALMAPGLARCDRDGVPAYLEATTDRNRALYERHGFRAHGSIPLPDGPALWRMWREPID